MKETVFGAVRAKASFEVQFTHSEEREGARVKHTFSVTWKPEDAKRADSLSKLSAAVRTVFSVR